MAIVQFLGGLLRGARAQRARTEEPASPRHMTCTIVRSGRTAIETEGAMIERTVTLPELALIAGTRAALGAGLGLLLADRLKDEQRRAVGWTLLAVGVLSTIPLATQVIFRRDSNRTQDGQARETDDETVSA